MASGQNLRTVRHHYEADFLALQEVLDDHLGAGGAELAVEHFARGANGFLMSVDDDDAFTGGEAAGLDDDRQGPGAHIRCIEVRAR